MYLTNSVIANKYVSVFGRAEAVRDSFIYVFISSTSKMTKMSWMVDSHGYKKWSL